MPVDDLARRLATLPGRRPAVAVDGPDAAGKTTLADAVADAADVPVVRASVDGFLRPRAQRAGLTPEAYWRSAFDVPALVRELVQPFTAGADSVRTAVRDHVRDVVVDPRVEVPPTAVLVVDGVYLLRPELRTWWDLSVLLDVPEEVTLARAAVRDRALLGGDVAARYRSRYLPAWRAYVADARPAEVADVVLGSGA